MGYIVMAYAEGGYQEHILPKLHDADYDIMLDKELFGFKDDLYVSLEIMDGKWKFLKKKELNLNLV